MTHTTDQLMMMALLTLCLVSTAPNHLPVLDVGLQPPAAGEEQAPESAAVERQAILSLAQAHKSSAADNLAGIILEQATAAGVDPLMVAAIVAKESSFRATVVSKSGAVGLMQLRPFVAREVAERLDLEWSGTPTLQEPESNLRLGICYYAQLVERFDGDVHLALAAYNRGPTRLSKQLRSGRTITSRYADRILGLYEELDRKRLSKLGTGVQRRA